VLDRPLLQRQVTVKTKLALGRETLQRLDGDALGGVRGGAGDDTGQLNTKTNGNNNTGDGAGRRTTCNQGFCCNGR
jgi:hypothetical protein